jgi:hypothetical protein
MVLKDSILTNPRDSASLKTWESEESGLQKVAKKNLQFSLQVFLKILCLLKYFSKILTAVLLSALIPLSLAFSATTAKVSA